MTRRGFQLLDEVWPTEDRHTLDVVVDKNDPERLYEECLIEFENYENSCDALKKRSTDSKRYQDNFVVNTNRLVHCDDDTYDKLTKKLGSRPKLSIKRCVDDFKRKFASKKKIKKPKDLKDLSLLLGGDKCIFKMSVEGHYNNLNNIWKNTRNQCTTYLRKNEVISNEMMVATDVMAYQPEMKEKRMKLFDMMESLAHKYNQVEDLLANVNNYLDSVKKVYVSTLKSIEK